MDADIKTDIMDCDYQTYALGYFNVVWSSPPCTEYSRAKTVGVKGLRHCTLFETSLLVVGEPANWIVQGSAYDAAQAIQRCGSL